MMSAVLRLVLLPSIGLVSRPPSSSISILRRSFFTTQSWSSPAPNASSKLGVSSSSSSTTSTRRICKGSEEGEEVLSGGNNGDDDDDEDEDDDVQASCAHTPVLRTEVLSAFRNVNLRTFLDCTLGAAGHASSIVKEHLELETFIGLDVDPVAHSAASGQLQDALEHRRNALTPSPQLNLHLCLTNFKNVKSVLEQLNLADQGIDGILMDLGMSSMQLHGAGRGFSLQQDGPLDMRMDSTSLMTASQILNNWPETEIGRILRDYGEERHWKRLSRRISEAQLAGGIHSTLQLLELIKNSLPHKFSPGRPGWKKTAIRVFQALRIAVNDELNALEAALPDVYACLRPKGRLAIISFHSLEDRIVKQFFLAVMGDVVKRRSRDVLTGVKDCGLSGLEDLQGIEEVEGSENSSRRVLEGSHALLLTRKPLIAAEEEIRLNPKARSAKLRILEKK